MKILHIANFGSEGLNGIVPVVLSLKREQELLGESINVGLINYNQNYKDDDTFVFYTDNSSFEKHLNVFQPDVVVFHALFYIRYVKFAKILCKRKIPYIITLHGAGSVANMKKHWLKKKIAMIVFFNSFIKKAAALSFLSQIEIDKCTLSSLNKNHIIIPNGIDNIIPKSQNVKHDRKEIIFLGRIDYYHKGIDILLKSFEIIKQKKNKIDFHFTFYGPIESGNLLSDIESYKDFVSWHNPVFGIKKLEAYHSADIFLLTSRLEGMPMGVLEALSCGVPCIVTPHTNVADLIRNNNAGWISQLDSNCIADTIIKAVGEYDSISEKLAENSIKAVQDFTWDKIAEKSIREYAKYIQINSKYVNP